MNLLIVLAGLLAGVVLFAYVAAPLVVWAVGGLVLLVALTQISTTFAGDAVLLLAWLGLLGLAAMLVPDIRKRLLTTPAFQILRRQMPTISRTEQEALDAGSVWWDGELFSGRPNWPRLLTLPNPGLSQKEQAFVDGPVEALCAMLDDWDVSFERGDLPPEVWNFIREKGFLGLIIPEKYGGLGFSARANSEIVMKISSRCSAAAVTVMVPNSLGPAELLLHYGTQAQCDHYLPRLASGEEIPCFALTNPEAGSDAASIPDHGVVCYGEWQGEQVLGMRVTWEKRYITLGPVATVLGLAFQLSDPDGLLGGEADVGITLALIPTSHPGVNIGRRHYPARQAFQNGPNSGQDVFIPMDWIIGGRERCGQGWRMLMNCLAAGRAISLPALGIAALKHCTRLSGAYARVRRQFGLPIGKFEGIEEPLARIAADTYVIDAARVVTAASIDAGEQPAVLSAILKYQATERMRRGVNDAMDIHGGHAICDGPSNYFMSVYTAIPVAITVEGANILTRSLIVFGQGVIRCHPWLLKEIATVAEPDQDKAIEDFDIALRGHVRYAASNFARAFVKSFSGGRLGSDPSSGEVNYWYAQIERWSAALAALADLALLLLGGALKRKEMLSGRFADALSELYLLSCTLKVFEDRGRPAQELPVLEYAMRQGLYNVQEQLYSIARNLPNPAIGWLLRRVLFPLGRRVRAPGDTLRHRVATLILEPHGIREQLARGVYVSSDPNDATGRIEHAYREITAVDALEQRLRNAEREGEIDDRDDWEAALAKGVLSPADHNRLKTAHAAVRRAIAVDDFAPDALARQRSEEPPRAYSQAV